MLRDRPRLLEMMLEDMARQRGIYQPGPFWTGYTRRVAAAIRAEGLAAFRSSTGIGKGFADVIPRDPVCLMEPGWRRSLLASVRSLPVVRGLAHRYGSLLAKRTAELRRIKSLYYGAVLGDWFEGFCRRYPDLPETCTGAPGATVEIAGREIGEHYLRMFTWLADYSKLVDFSQVRVLMELGGGFGAMSHAALHLFPNMRKLVYLDIPPMLYVGTQYLESFFGGAVIDYEQTRGRERLTFSDDDELEILAICPWQIETLECPVDVFWNSSSFQEMPREIVANYARHLDRLLAPSGELCVFVYDGGKSDRTLKAAEVVEVLEEETSFRLQTVPGEMSQSVLPGDRYCGRRA